MMSTTLKGTGLYAFDAFAADAVENLGIAMEFRRELEEIDAKVYGLFGQFSAKVRYWGEALGPIHRPAGRERGVLSPFP